MNQVECHVARLVVQMDKVLVRQGRCVLGNPLPLEKSCYTGDVEFLY